MGNFSVITISATFNVFQLFSFCYSGRLYFFPIRKGGEQRELYGKSFLHLLEGSGQALRGAACVVRPLWTAFHCLLFLSCQTHECISLRPSTGELGRAPGRKARESMASLSPALLTPELACLSKLSIKLTHLDGHVGIHYSPSSFCMGNRSQFRPSTCICFSGIRVVFAWALFSQKTIKRSLTDFVHYFSIFPHHTLGLKLAVVHTTFFTWLMWGH